MSRANMRGVVPLPYPPPPPGLARGVTNSTSVSRPILCTLLGDGGDGTTSTSAPPATSTDPTPGCGVCARVVTSVSADGRLMSQGDQSDIRLGHRGIQSSTFLMDVAIRCTTPNCSCDCFTPGKTQLRTCNTCKHGWVSHALDKLGFRHLYNCHQVELVQPSIAFDIASLMLYGTQAIPIRLKILLDRLFSVLQHEEVLQVLHGFGWTYEDYARGYILQDAAGNVLDRWILATREEEPLILQQFLRFGETKTISQQLLVQESSERTEYIVHAPRADSDIKKFIDRTNRVANTAFLKHNSVYTPSPHGIVTSLPVTCPSMFRHPSSVSSTHSLSPTDRSPIERTSPLAMSPLNKLQNMQPYDFRQEKNSPETRTPDAPVVSVAHSTPLSSPSTSIPSLPTLSTSLTNHTSTTTVNSDFSATDGGSEDDTNSAINLSQSCIGNMDSVYAAKKVRHLRKSANPMKRRWNPIVLSTLNTNPSTGKKRVQCHVCLKTFCDKGALKIHFSAVHLREMHKCTVEGCNMMFSSRRSRNRHSANPNPKLHTPNLRRKLNPHDGRTSHPPFPLIPPSALINFNSSLIPTGVNSMIERECPVTSESESHIPMGTVRDTVVSHAEDTALRHEEESALPLTKKARVEESIEDISNGAEEGIDLTIKDDSLVNKGVRKRKSLNPTKCAVTSDDDLQYVSTDDSSSDTYIDHENGLLDSKSEDGTSDFADDSKDEDLDKDDLDDKDDKQRYNLPTRPSVLPYEPPKTEPNKEQNVETKPSLDFSKHGISISQQSEVEDLSENPLRHLESLSLGAFTSMVATNSRNHLTHSNPVTSGVVYHAPGLGLASSVPSDNCREIAMSGSDLPGNTGPPPAPYPSVNNNSDQESDHMSLMPVYRDASLGTSMEIPVDKENPRRCTACGKIFQNHFGVKTHYQNVHLKLMHKCTVEGCNAAFPSKRSRDRHSANLNLHRKLLSTSSDKSGSFFDKGSLYPYHPGAALRDDFFSRLYDPQSLSLGFPDIYHGRIPTCGPDGLVTGASFSNHLSASNPLSNMPSFHPAFIAPTSSASGGTTLSEGVAVVGTSGRDSPASTMSSAPSPQPASPSPNKTYPLCLDEELGADEDGKYSCQFCNKKFHENVVLREHYEKSHTQDLQRCTVEGCIKVFLSRRTRNLHEELHNDNNKKDKTVSTS